MRRSSSWPVSHVPRPRGQKNLRGCTNYFFIYPKRTVLQDKK